MAEKARGDSVRRHGAGGAMANLLLLSTTSYQVTMDFDGNGVVDAYDTQTFNLENGVAFATGFVGTTITFDWRGRSVTGQVSPTMILNAGLANSATTLITISGSGDITLDSETFPDGSIPDVALSGTPATTYGRIRHRINARFRLISPTPTPSGTPDQTQHRRHIQPRRRYQHRLPAPTASIAVMILRLRLQLPGEPGARGPSPSPSSGQCTLSASPSSLTLGNHETTSLSLRSELSGTTTVSMSSNNNPRTFQSPAPGAGIVTVAAER